MNKEDKVKELLSESRMKDGRRFYNYSLIKDGIKYYATIMLARVIWNLYNLNDKIVHNDGYLIHHIDGNKLNDNITNLKKVTRKEHGVLHGIGDNNPMYDKDFSKEHRQKLSLSRTGEKNPMYGKFGKESPHYGKKWSKERKRKHSLLIKKWHKKKKKEKVKSEE